MKKILVILVGMAIIFGCSKDEDENIYTNGTYNAEEAEFHYGWKGFMTIQITNDMLVSVDFDYLNEEGTKKSETTVETYPMDPHPTVWVPTLEGQLLSADILNFSDVDGVTGATSSSGVANIMIKLLLDAAKTGDTSKQIIAAE